VGTSPGSILFPFPTDPSHAATFWNDPPSGSSEAARRANLEEAGHENNMLQEGNDLTMKLDTEKRESQRREYPLNVVDILFFNADYLRKTVPFQHPHAKSPSGLKGQI
jgi:hypothetical protein